MGQDRKSSSAAIDEQKQAELRALMGDVQVALGPPSAMKMSALIGMAIDTLLTNGMTPEDVSELCVGYIAQVVEKLKRGQH